MIPTTTTNSVSTNTSSPTQFQIADSSVLVELLSSKLYTNKINSFIREIGTNALDANISSGSIEPITIDIGKDGEIITVAIGDTGLGMSPETISTKLAVLGVSTKNTDNSAHGGYGIGFLSTLSVSRQIEIFSDCEGVNYHYKITEDSGQLAIYLVDSRPSKSAKSGTIVKTWLNRSGAQLDRIARELRQAIVHLAYHLTPTPIITCRDWQLYSVTNFETEVRRFKSSFVTGDDSYAWHVPPTASYDRSSSLSDKYLVDCPHLTIALLGQVAYVVAPRFIAQGFQEWVAGQGTESFAPPDFYRLEDFIGSSRHTSGSLDADYTNYRNCLFLKFGIGELEVTTSRESLAQTAANSSKIFDRLLTAFPLIAQAVRSKLVHSVDEAGIFGNRIEAYFKVAASWGFPTVKLNDIDIAPLDGELLPKFWSHWVVDLTKEKGEVFCEYSQENTFSGRSEVTPAALLGLMIKMELRVGKPRLVFVVGSRDNSSPRLLAKFAPKDTIDPARVILVKVDSHHELDGILTDYLWLRDFADVYIRDVPPVAPKFIANSSVNNTLLWADLRDEETCPIFRDRRYGQYIVRDSSLPKLNLSAFKKSNLLTDRIYYFTPSNLNQNNLLCDLFIQSLDAFDLKLPEFYILGDSMVKHLDSIGYNLRPAWNLILPAIDCWIETELAPCVEKLGYIPTYYTETRSDSRKEIERLRVGLIGSRQVLAFIDPDRVWLAKWLKKEYELLHLVVEELPSLISRTYFDPIRNPMKTYFNRLAELKLKSSLPEDFHGDRALSASMQYLFHDVLTTFPILTTTWGVCSGNGLLKKEEYAIALWRKEIASGCLKNWRDKH